MLIVRKLTLADVKVKFEALEEDQPIFESIESGDPEYAELEKKEAQDIANRLGRGDLSAWFTAKITVVWGEFSATDYLGACSYDSFEQFTSDPDGYYSDMVNTALDRLNDQIAAFVRSLSALIIE